MDSFGSDYSSAAGSGKMDTGTIMEQVKVQIAVANAQELLQRMTDKCFKKCIGKPGSTLDNSEQVGISFSLFYLCMCTCIYDTFIPARFTMTQQILHFCFIGKKTILFLYFYDF
uniref:Mitochondrial import inner membrane translocase subunit n=1 Tax=Astyanax mexicanus TaxID=7994 RepID=A0A3B1JPV0_ASTMX